MTTHLAYSRSFPVGVEQAFERTVTVPLERILGQRHLVIPGVRRTEQDGAWGDHVGQQRTIVFTDGGRARETALVLDAPLVFTYRLDQVRGPMRALMREVEGTWAFAPAGTGTRITWTWAVTPANPVAARLLPAVRPAWTGAARRGFDRLETHLLA